MHSTVAEISEFKSGSLRLARLRCGRRLVIMPFAAHLFEELETLDEVIRLTAGSSETRLAGRSVWNSPDVDVR